MEFAVEVLYFQNFGQTDNCIVEVSLKWSDQSHTPSATPADWLPSSEKREILTCTQSKLRSRTKPGYVRSLGYDSVSACPRVK